MAKKARKPRRKLSAKEKAVRSRLVKLRSQLTPAGRKQVNALVKAFDQDCTDGLLGRGFFAKKSRGK